MKDTIVVNFGRYQGPHRGHEMLMNFIKDLAERKNADYKIFLSNTFNEKNPIPVDTKERILKLLLPQHADNIFSEHNTVVAMLQSLQQEYRNVIFVCGSDRYVSFNSFLNNYNGIQYEFDSLKVLAAGDPRTDISNGISGCSASKMRGYVEDCDIISFTQDSPTAANARDIQTAFDEMTDAMLIQRVV